MAKSSSSQHRAQLIREMSKDMNKTRNSSSSRHSQGIASPQNTFPDFDPENEALMSTRQLDDISPQLPELRASAQKYRHKTLSSPSSLSDYVIDTSAMARAFPNFTQGSNPSPDNSSLSIEIGRGAKKGSYGTIGKPGRSREYSNAQLGIDEDTLDLQQHFIGDYEVMYTPPLGQRTTPKKTDESAPDLSRRDIQAHRARSLQKEIFVPSPPPAKTKDSGSERSRQTTGEPRRTMVSMHALVKDDNDKSLMNDERPPTVDLTARNTRFANTKSHQTAPKDGLPNRLSSAQALLDPIAPKNKAKTQGTITPTQGTQQSFKLPTLPNLFELVSGVFEDGTPVFSRDGKPRNSRFISALQRSTRFDEPGAPAEDLPMRMDEKAIFLNIKMLQDKVAILEKHNREAASTISDLRKKNQVLEGEKNVRESAAQTDSGLVTTDNEGGIDVACGQRKILIEKNRLESSVHALQAQMDASNRKASTAEAILKIMTNERDSAVSQLSVAFFTVEQLKSENEALREENNVLKTRLGQFTTDHENETQKWTAKEGAMRRNLGRRVQAVKSMMEEAGPQSSVLPSHSALAPHLEDRTETHGRKAGQGGAFIHKDAGTLFDLQREQDPTDGVKKSRQQAVDNDDARDSEDASYTAPLDKGKAKVGQKQSRRVATAANDGNSLDLTYLSFIDNNEIAQLRKTLEQERIERKKRQTLKRPPSKGDNTFAQTGPLVAQQQQSQQALPHQSTMKDLTARSLARKNITEPSLHPKEPAEHNRRHSETSILSIRSRRRGIDADNITSAFIVPDITIRNLGISPQQVPELTKEAQEILDKLDNHSAQNCTVCKLVYSNCKHHDHTQKAKETIKIPKPVPVSERMPAATGDEDHTVRPAQSPGLALATVMKGLEDELAHLKIQLTKYQAIYSAHDAALSKRSRKTIQQKMGNLLQAIDVKADQIYSLYDVLEAQKRDGHEITAEEVEITLQSIGADVVLRGGGDEKQEIQNTKKAAEHHPWDLESEGDSEDLPWEGIESSAETTKSGFSKGGRRRSPAN